VGARAATYSLSYPVMKLVIGGANNVLAFLLPKCYHPFRNPALQEARQETVCAFPMLVN
jgi:hypothetical protein